MDAKLKAIIDELATQPSLSAEETDRLMERAFTEAITPESRKEAGEYLRTAISRRKRPDIDVKGILGEASEFLNLSYIAKRYFGKDRTWLYQRLNGSMVNGHPAAFTESELRTFSDSLNEISDIVKQTSLNLTH